MRENWHKNGLKALELHLYGLKTLKKFSFAGQKLNLKVRGRGGEGWCVMVELHNTYPWINFIPGRLAQFRQPYQTHSSLEMTMVIILDGNSEIDAHVRAISVIWSV